MSKIVFHLEESQSLKIGKSSQGMGSTRSYYDTHKIWITSKNKFNLKRNFLNQN